MDYKKKIFKDEILPAGAVVRDARFIQCSFINCWNHSMKFSLVEHVTFERTTLKTKSISAIICRDVTVDTCKNTATFIATNCLFDRVTMTGRFGSWMFNRLPEHLSPAQKAQADKFYDGVEWALDIREARFKDLTLRGVPGDKIRRDPERHYLLRKDRLLADRSWEKFDVGLVAVLSASIARPDESEILAVSEDPDTFESDMVECKMLREAGFAE